MINLSHHAQIRAQQRGITPTMIEAILDNADVDQPIGNGCTLFRMSRRRGPALAGAEKLSRFAVVWSDTNAQVVTVLPLHSSAAGRRYRTIRGE
jgi:hypothetical protein